MYSRSERICIEPNTSTNENIGPGYYDYDVTSILPKRPSTSAPFLQKAPRVCYFDEVAKNSGPAPGSFELNDSNVPHHEVKAIPFAASQTPRFKLPPSSSPGPGNYDPATDLGANEKKKLKIKIKNTKKIVWKRKFMPPSIPFGAQAAGYEETEGGELVLRKDASKHETDPKDRLVPHGDFIRSSAGTHFGKTSSRRYVWGENTNPAPGMYNLSTPWPCANPKRTSSSPVTANAIRFGEYVIADAIKKAVPGPGTYNLQLKLPPEQPHCVPFGKSPARSSKPPITPFAYNSQPPNETSPGPCSYDVVRATSSKKPMHVSRKPFDSSGQRFALMNSNSAPGPGQYQVAKQLIKLDKRPFTAVSTISAFGSVSERFRTPPRLNTPGPAEYQIPVTSKKTKKVMTIAHLFSLYPETTKAVFLSSQSRFPQTLKETPSPGHYDIDSAYKNLVRKGKLAHHGTTSKREVFSMEQGEIPGPSDYHPKIPFADHLIRSAFSSKLPRFPSSKHEVPAANQYVGHSDFVKKTFNKSLSAQ